MPLPPDIFAENVDWAKRLAAALARRHRARADDAEADALIGLWHASTRWDCARGDFRAYARARVKGAVLDGLRLRAGRSKHAPRLVPLDDALGVPDRSESAADRVELADELAHALAPLPPLPLVVITGRLGGETLAAVGRRVRRSPSAVSRIARRALAAIAREAA